MSDSYLQRSRAVAQLVHVAQQLYKSVTELVRRFDLTESQYNALRVLRGAERRSESLTQADLADRLIASRANTTWILDKLEERRLARRKGHADRRKNLVEITAAGEKLLARIDPEFERLLEGVLHNVTSSDLDSLQAIIKRFQFEPGGSD